MVTTVRKKINGQYVSIADAKADLTLKIGETVKTSNYYSGIEGGGGEYLVVASGTGVADGGSYHNTSNGNQLELIYEEALKITQFGAIGDGVTDCLNNISSALSFACTNGLRVDIPAGVFFSSQQIAFGGGDISIQGKGSGISVLLFSGTSGLNYDGGSISQSTFNKIEARDFTIRSATVGVGSGFVISYQDGSGTTTNTAVIENVIVDGSGLSNHFNIGFDTDNLRNSIFKNCIVNGSSNNQTGISEGFRIGDANARNPVDIILSNCSVFFADKAVSIGSGGLGNAEGVSITGGRYVLNNYGVYWNTLNNKPLLHVVDTHMASRISCVYARKCVQAIVTGNLFYVRDETDQNFISVDISTDVTVALDSLVTDNIIRCNKNITPLTDGISVDGIRGVIANNSISEPDTGIICGANSNNLTIDNNNIRLPVVAYSDNGTNNKINDLERGNLRITSGNPTQNYVEIEGSDSASGPKVKVNGPDADLGLRYLVKGAGLHQFLTGLNELFRIYGIDNAANFIAARASLTGNAVSVEADGTDTNIDLLLSPKGAGRLSFGSHSALGGESVTGYITVKDSTGTERKLAVVS